MSNVGVEGAPDLGGLGRKLRNGVRPPTAKALKRREELYRVAAEIFHVKGYSATSLKDIADAMGLLKGSLYYYIDSKEDLLFGITMAIHELARRNLEDTEALVAPSDERLAYFIEHHLLGFATNLPMVRVFYTDYGMLTGQRRRQVMDERRRYEQFTVSLVEQGQRDGCFCPELDARFMATAILTMINSIYIWYRPGSHFQIGHVAAESGRFAVRGLQCPIDGSHQHGSGHRAPTAT